MPIPGPPITSTSIVKFVDSIDASPTTRLALNDGASFITLRDGTSFNPPPLNQPTSALPGVFDGAPPTASSYGNRVIDLKLRLKAADEDGLANLIRALMVELNRNTNILMLQVGSTPLFFRTYRTSAEDVDFGDLGLGECTATVPLLAEPFAYGLRVDQGVVAWKGDATLANGLYVDASGVLGDVDTPAYIKTDSGMASGIQAVYFATRRHGTPASAPYVIQAEAMASAIGDTALLADGINATGAGSNTRQTTFASSTSLVDRLTYTIPSSVDARGVYRVLMRGRKTTGADIVTARITVPGAPTILGTTTTISEVTTGYRVSDLGLLAIPVGPDSFTGYSGQQPTPASVSITLQLGRTSGAGNFIADELILVPADAELSLVSYDTNIDTIFDGPNDVVYYLAGGLIGNSGGNSTSPARAGSLPMLTPGVTTRIALVASTFSPSSTMNVTVSHWPRHLVV